MALGCNPELLPEDKDAHEDDLREQHYVFAHRLLPDRVFADPEGFATIMRQPDARDWLVRLWERAGDEARGSNRPPLAADGLDVVIDNDRVVVTMPPPEAPIEAYAATVVRRDARWRYLVLERLGGPWDARAVLCEWLPNDMHLNHSLMTAGTRDAPPRLNEFLALVENLDIFQELVEQLPDEVLVMLEDVDFDEGKATFWLRDEANDVDRPIGPIDLNRYESGQELAEAFGTLMRQLPN